ncbi:hypothetical protein LWI29_001546 [Acer saccharum]|uniref:Uncharacterized protein n=1 Tax=Acer saccharum TaxID=4024 RepID=A0AA39SZX4_ACESA|nr:hypothetical protein LWI29_001546 [Acer saccharum]
MEEIKASGLIQEWREREERIAEGVGEAIGDGSGRSGSRERRRQWRRRIDKEGEYGVPSAFKKLLNEIQI